MALGSLFAVFLLLIVFIVVPLAELYVIIKVGGAIGILPTLVLLLLDSILGAALLRHQGRAAWVSFNRALSENRVPTREVLDGALVIFGGALLLTPGFITDIFGILLLIPPTRAVVRGLTTRLALGRLRWGPRMAFWGFDRATRGRGRGRSRRASSGPAGASAGTAGNADPWSGFPPPGGRAARPGDIEGTAEEVTEHDSLQPGDEPRERGAQREPGGRGS